MIRLTLALLIVSTLPPTKPVDENYTAVRNDVLAQMNAADVNLPKCEEALDEAQKELQRAKVEMIELRAAAEALKQQNEILKALIDNRPATGGFVEAWEQIDGPVGLTLGWGIGTLQCVGLAWVFNQDGFTR